MKKSILITGACGGIGKETIKLFYNNNWQVYGTSISKEKQQELQKEFPNGKFYILDIRNETQVMNIINEIGAVSVLINNAGDKVRGRLEEIKTEDYERVMDVNVRGTFLMMKYMIPLMKKNGGGKIINIASVIGCKECKYLSPYSASKHAIVGLSHSVREELIDNNDKIYVSLIYPGITNTPFNLPKEGMMNPKEVTEAIKFVAERKDDVMCDLFIYNSIEKRRP